MQLLQNTQEIKINAQPRGHEDGVRTFGSLEKTNKRFVYQLVPQYRKQNIPKHKMDTYEDIRKSDQGNLTAVLNAPFSRKNRYILDSSDSRLTEFNRQHVVGRSQVGLRDWLRRGCCGWPVGPPRHRARPLSPWLYHYCPPEGRPQRPEVSPRSQ